MTMLCLFAAWRLRGPAMRRWMVAGFVFATVTCTGCQAMFPALPGGMTFNEEQRIAKKAKGDSFPSPADVGLTTAVPTP